MRSKDEAITALFGDKPYTELPPILNDWEPSDAMVAFAQDKGFTSVAALLTDGAETFCSDPAYFDEVTHDAVTARQTRRSVKGRQT